jgi:hypothetical protein
MIIAATSIAICLTTYPMHTRIMKVTLVLESIIPFEYSLENVYKLTKRLELERIEKIEKIKFVAN